MNTVKRVRCTYCGSTTHEIKYCPKTWAGQSNINNHRCTYCGSKNHERKDCPKAW